MGADDDDWRDVAVIEQVTVDVLDVLLVIELHAVALVVTVKVGFTIVCDGLNDCRPELDFIIVLEIDAVMPDVFETVLVEVTETLPEGVFDLLGVDVTVFVETPVTVLTD